MAARTGLSPIFQGLLELMDLDNGTGTQVRQVPAPAAEREYLRTVLCTRDTLIKVIVALKLVVSPR